MNTMNIVNPHEWKEEMKIFREGTAAFCDGNMTKKEYKGFSGRYGSYAQKNHFHMLRLRMTAGRITKKKLAFLVDMIQKYGVELVHFTTCQSVQLHNLNQVTVGDIMEAALDVDIVTIGGGGDFPRNIMCSPLSGVEVGENFDVLPYAEVTGTYMMNFMNAQKMPRKLKIGFSNSPKNLTHATYRDLGFVSRKDGRFDVYSAGGLGNNPEFGVKVAEAIEPEKILYYVKAMWSTFITYGDYTNRAKARTRYMPERLGGKEKYKKAYLEQLEEVMNSGEDLDISVNKREVSKVGDGCIQHRRVLMQKQRNLYTVEWHPIGGQPSIATLIKLNQVIQDMDEVEIRLAPDETAYIINLTAGEAKEILDITKEGAKTVFETSVSCIGASICQVGFRDSQALLKSCVEAVRAAEIPDKALPQIHISGCPSSCGTHQTGKIGFRGASKLLDGKASPAFLLYVNGNHMQGRETMGREVGAILEKEIPKFLVKLGQTVAESGMDFETWNEKNKEGIERVAREFI